MRNEARVLVMGLVAMAAGMVWGATPPEAVGFFGMATGKVVSAKEDGTSFVLQVMTAEPDTQSAVKDGKVMVGKELTLGTRMPKKEGVGTPHVEDVAFIKGL